MADAKLTALTAASALAAADLFYVSQSAASRKATGTQLLALVGTAYVPLAGGTMTGALTLPAGAVGTPSLTFTGSAATTGIYSSAPNTVAISISGTRRFYMDDVGGVVFTNTSFTSGGLFTTAGNIRIADASTLGWSSTGDPTATQDVFLRRDEAAALAQRNGTTQQIFRLYNTYTDASNYERLTLTGVAGTSVNITAETLGTGGDNLNIVLTPAGTGQVRFPIGTYDKPGIGFSATSGFWVNGGGTGVGLSIGGAVSFFATTTLQSLPTAGLLGWSSVGAAGQATPDVAFSRSSAGLVQINNGTAGAYRDLIVRNVKTDPVAFASLVAAATAGNGARAMITNCSHATFGTAADGGGSTKVPVYSDGTSWLVG